MRKIIYFLSLFLTCFNCYSQITWERCYGGTSEDRLNNSSVGHSNIIKTFDYNFVIAGNTNSIDGDITSNNGGRDYWIIKIDTDGNLIWQKNYGGSNDDEANKIIETADHGYLVVGHTFSADGDVTNYKGGYDVWVLKLDSVGNLQWQKTYGGTGFDIGTSACQDSNSYIITGCTASNDIDVSGNHNINNYDVWTIKIDLNGNIIWQRCLGGTGTDTSVDIIKTAENDYVICGTTYSTNGDVQSNTHSINSQTDTWIVKLDAAGNIIYEKCLGGTAQEYGCGLINDTDGNYVILSTSASIDGDVTGHHGNTGFQDYWVTKINKDNGTIIWEKSLGGSNEEQAGDISLASNGDYLINGIGLSSNGDVSSPNNGGRDYWMVRLTSNLTIAWDYTLGTSAEEWGISIIEAEPSCYIVTGNGSGKFIIGQGGYDFWTAKICEETLNAISIGEDNDVILFPNPMSKSSTLIFDDYINNYKVEIYNVYGKSISSLVNITGNMTKINTEELTSGIYFLTVFDESNRIVTTKKISISH